MEEILKQFTARTFTSFRILNYRRYAIGQFISQCGTWMQTVVLGWLVIDVGGSGTELGAVIALQFLPILFLGPWGGVIADRFRKIYILYFTHVVFGILALAMGLVVKSGATEIWMLYVFSFALGIVRVFDNPARQAMASELVPSEFLKNAVSLNATANNLARAVGPAIGGALIAGVSIAGCFFFNAVSYLIAVAMLYRLDTAKLLNTVPSGKKPGQLQEGFRYVMATPVIRRTLLMMAIIGTFSYEFQVSLPLLANLVFQGGASNYAALLGAMGIGSVIGGLYAAGRSKISYQNLIFFALLFGTSMFLTSFAPILNIAIVGMLFVGFFSINFTSLATTMLQLESDPSMRGRVMALWSVAFIGSTTIGGPIIGFIGEFAGGRWGLGFGGLVAILTATFAIAKGRKMNLSRSISPAVELGSFEAQSAPGKL